jgi:hypothetical protein
MEKKNDQDKHQEVLKIHTKVIKLHDFFWYQLLNMFDKQWEHFLTSFFMIPSCKKPIT